MRRHVPSLCFHLAFYCLGSHILCTDLCTLASLNNACKTLFNPMSLILLPLLFPHANTHTHSTHPSLAMSSRPKRKTLAQLRAEKEQRAADCALGRQLAQEVVDRGLRIGKELALSAPDRYAEWNASLSQAKRACDLLRHGPDTEAYLHTTRCQGKIHKDLGQHALALAAFREVEELCLAACREGWGSDRITATKTRVITNLGFSFFCFAPPRGGQELFFKSLG